MRVVMIVIIIRIKMSGAEEINGNENRNHHQVMMSFNLSSVPLFRLPSATFIPSSPFSYMVSINLKIFFFSSNSFLLMFSSFFPANH